MSRLIDADELKKDDEVTMWLSKDPVRTGKQLRMFSEYFINKIDNMPTVQAVPIPENATNGEIILSLFPTAETWAEEDECCMNVHFPDAFNIENFDLVWWNDKYDGVIQNDKRRKGKFIERSRRYSD